MVNLAQLTNRRWLRRSVAVGLGVEALYMLGLTYIMTSMVLTYARFESDPVNPLVLLAAGLAGGAIAFVLLAAGVSAWRGEPLADRGPITRWALPAAALLHLLLALGAVVSGISVVAGRIPAGSWGGSVLGWAIFGVLALFAAGVLGQMTARGTASR